MFPTILTYLIPELSSKVESIPNEHIARLTEQFFIQIHFGESINTMQGQYDVRVVTKVVYVAGKIHCVRPIVSSDPFCGQIIFEVKYRFDDEGLLQTRVNARGKRLVFHS